MASVPEGGVIAAVAATIGVKTGGDDLPARVANALAEESTLIVLDNCEHVVVEAAHVAESLLRAAATVHILATSREGLGVHGESLFLIPPLDPDAAVQLFIERANRAPEPLELGASERAAVRDICIRLDGLPLAIELAAARTRVLDVMELSRRLNNRFALLTGGPRTALPRHQTLRAVVDWSYDALTPESAAGVRAPNCFR